MKTSLSGAASATVSSLQALRVTSVSVTLYLVQQIFCELASCAFVVVLCLVCWASCILHLLASYCRSVAAGNERKYDDSFVPLQDNVAIVAQALEQRSALAQFVLRWHWAHIANFLFSFLCIPFSVLWDQVRCDCEIEPNRLYLNTDAV